MKILIVFVCFLLTAEISFAQRKKISLKIKQIYEQPDEREQVHTIRPDTNALDFSQLDEATVCSFLKSGLKNEMRKRDSLYSSSILDEAAQLCANEATNHFFSNKRGKWMRNKFIRIAAKRHMKYGVIRSAMFDLPVLNAKGKAFFYDKTKPGSAFHVFQGTKKNNKSLPVNSFTQHEFMEKFLAEFRRSGLLQELEAGAFSYVGIGIKIRKKTLNRNKIPEIRVYVFLGAKRLRLVKTP